MSMQVDYQQFLDTLIKLIEKKTTANLILLTEDSHSLWLGLEAGSIHTIIFGPKRGRSAIPLITKIRGGRLSLDTKTKLPPMSDLPPTNDILSELSSLPNDQFNTGSSASLDNTRISLIIDDLKQQLKRHLGPIADMIMPKIIQQVGDISSENQLQLLVDKLVKEVEGIGDTSKFLREAAEIIRRY